VSATISSISSKRIDQFYTIAGLIDGCATFVPGFNGDDIYVERISVEGSGEDNEVEIIDK